jgi:tetratricopeptide (TPR) repeat protein
MGNDSSIKRRSHFMKRIKQSKRILSLLIVLVLSFCLVFCSKEKSDVKLNPDNIEANLKSIADKEEPITYKNIVIKPKKQKEIKKYVVMGSVIVVSTGVVIASSGTLAPAVGTWVGTTFMGLHGVAATNAGLAILGGGAVGSHALAFGMAGGTFVVASLTDAAVGFIAQETLDRLVAAGENKFHKQAQKEMELKNDTMAYSLFRESIVNKKDVLRSYFALGLLEMNKKAYLSAKEIFEKIATISPHSSMAIYQLGLAYLLSGDVEKGIDYLKLCIKEEPNWDEPYITLYQTYLDNGDETKAFETLMSGVKINPGSFQLNYQAGIAFSNKSDWNAAIAYLTSALKCGDKTVDAYLFRGLSYQKIGKDDDALKDYLAIHKKLKDQTPYGVNINIGKLYLAKGDKKNTTKYFKEARTKVKDLIKKQNVPEQSDLLKYLEETILANS